MNLGVIFLTGLTVGGLTCLAVQGGLLASVIAVREEESKGTDIAKHAMIATAAFLLFKLIAHILLGFVLGAFGGAISINGDVQTFMQLAAGVYMIAVALNLLNIHPIFRYVIVQPPRFLTKLVRNQAKSKDLFAPALLGAMTVFIPCGTTVAMEALAVSSANAVSGALILGTFVVGTVPLFFGIGAVTSLMGEAFKTNFLKLAAFAVMYLGITSVNGSLVALGSPLTIQSVVKEFTSVLSISSSSSSSLSVNQNPIIEITSGGYNPTYIRVKKGEQVTLTVKNIGAFTCAGAFRIPSLGIRKDIWPDESAVFTFTPQEVGTIPFSCSMGMYRGVIEVI